MDNVFLPPSLSDHPSLVGIVRMPKSGGRKTLMNVTVVMKDDQEQYFSGIQVVEMNETINQSSVSSKDFIIDKEKITDFFPYTYYVLTDGECEPLVLHPQYMDKDNMVAGKFALSHNPIERYFIPGYKGDLNGQIFNITNVSQMMIPTATNEGINFMTSNANATLQNKKNTIVNTVLGSAGALVTGNVGMALGGVMGGIQNIQSANARLQDIALTPNSISSYGTPSTRKAFSNDSVRVLKFTIKDVYKNKINNYIKRFGNKFNNYDTVDIKTYKGYIKYIMPDVDGNIDNVYMKKIIEVLERGIYIE